MANHQWWSDTPYVVETWENKSILGGVTYAITHNPDWEWP